MHKTQSLNNESRSILRDILSKINPCPRCHSGDRHFESHITISRDVEDASLSTPYQHYLRRLWLCPDIQKSETLSDRLAEGSRIF